MSYIGLQCEQKDSPHALCGDGKQEHVHALNQLCGRERRTHGFDAIREDMVCEELRVAVVSVEMVYKILRARPHEHIVRGISKMISQTAAKVPCAEH